MRVLVCGGRDYSDIKKVRAELEFVREYSVFCDSLNAERPDYRPTIVHGAARGADALAARIAFTEFEMPTEAHIADWRGPCRPECKPGHRRPNPAGGQIMPADYCPAAGVYRNQEMLESGVDLVLAFPGGTGTADMVRRARKAGIDVREVS